MAVPGAVRMVEFDGGFGRLDNADFERVASFMLSATGIRLTAGKKTMVEGRLYRRVRALGLPSISDYIARVFDFEGGDDEVINLIDAITTNKTDFFREPVHFNFLKQTVLPDLAVAGHAAKVWSAACSIGAEPYTMAMVMGDFARGAPNWGFSILASDINTEVLATAARAVYSEDMVEPVPLELRQRYLLRSTNSANKVVRMVPEIRSLVRFARINLVEDRYPVDRDMDVIFCRNLLIYFDRQTQESVVRQLSAHLRVGGYLMLGLTDSITGMSVPLTSLGHSIFRRI